MDQIQFQKNFSALVQPAYPVSLARPAPRGTAETARTGGSFESLLEQKQKLVFSGHAQQRLESRRISLSPQSLAQVGDAVERAREKGIREALIVQDRTAFIVNIPSSTVVTVLGKEEMNSHVFSNIDGAVIV